MTELRGKLAAHRRRIRLVRISDALMKGAFFASLAGCAALAALKVGGASGASVPLLAALALVPLALGVRAALRPFSLRDCAVHLDRTLGLDERLSTAVEFAGAMSGVQERDAVAALAGATLPPRRLPREGKLLAGSGLLLLVLVAIPAPELARAASGDPVHEEFVADEGAALENLAGVDVEFREVAELLKAGKPEEALDRLEEIRSGLLRKILEGKDDGGRAADALEAAGESARAISAELARLGRTVHAPPPSTVRMKLARHGLDAPDDPISNRAAAVRRGMAEGDEAVHPRYDPVIRNYFRLRSKP